MESDHEDKKMSANFFENRCWSIFEVKITEFTINNVAKNVRRTVLVKNFSFLPSFSHLNPVSGTVKEYDSKNTSCLCLSHCLNKNTLDLELSKSIFSFQECESRPKF